MAALKAFVAVAAIAVLVQLATAKNFTVGSPGSWDLQTNLTAWAQRQTFTQGDNLIFQYDSSSHDVLEVTKANHDSCGTNSPIKKYTSGNDVIPLSSTGKRYFICGTPRHCAAGMKMEIDTVAASGPTPPSSPGSNPSPPPSTTPPPPTNVTSPPPPGTSGANSLRAEAAVGFGLGLLMLLAF